MATAKGKKIFPAIKIGSYHPIKILSITDGSPLVYGAQLMESLKCSQKLEDDIAHVANRCPPLRCPRVGDFVLALSRDLEDPVWCRSLIQAVNGDHFDVEHVEYGCYEKVHVSDIRELPDSLDRIAPCSLLMMSDAPFEMDSEYVVKILESLDETHRLYRVAKHDGEIPEEDSTPITSTLPALQLESREQIYIVAVEKLHASVQFCKYSEDELRELNAKVDEASKKAPGIKPGDVKKGDFVGVLVADAFYRGQVYDVEEDFVMVYQLDFGVLSRAKYQELRTLPDRLLEAPQIGARLLLRGKSLVAEEECYIKNLERVKNEYGFYDLIFDIDPEQQNGTLGEAEDLTEEVFHKRGDTPDVVEKRLTDVPGIGGDRQSERSMEDDHSAAGDLQRRGSETPTDKGTDRGRGSGRDLRGTREGPRSEAGSVETGSAVGSSALDRRIGSESVRSVKSQKSGSGYDGDAGSCADSDGTYNIRSCPASDSKYGKPATISPSSEADAAPQAVVAGPQQSSVSDLTMNQSRNKESLGSGSHSTDSKSVRSVASNRRSGMMKDSDEALRGDERGRCSGHSDVAENGIIKSPKSEEQCTPPVRNEVTSGSGHSRLSPTLTDSPPYEVRESRSLPKTGNPGRGLSTEVLGPQRSPSAMSLQTTMSMEDFGYVRRSEKVVVAEVFSATRLSILPIEFPARCAAVESLYKDIDKTPVDRKDLEISGLYLCGLEEGKVSRCRIVDLDPLRVYLVDCGTTEDPKRAEFFEMPEPSIEDVPGVARIVQLLATDNALSEFTEDDQSRYYGQYRSKEPDHSSIDWTPLSEIPDSLFLGETCHLGHLSNQLGSVSRQLIMEGLAVQYPPTFKNSPCPPIDPSMDGFVDSRVLGIEKKPGYEVVELLRLDARQSLEAALESVDQGKLTLMLNAKRNALVLLKPVDQESESWKRGVIIGRPAPSRYRIFLVDQGISIIHPTLATYRCPVELCYLPIPVFKMAVAKTHKPLQGLRVVIKMLDVRSQFDRLPTGFIHDYEDEVLAEPCA